MPRARTVLAIVVGINLCCQAQAADVKLMSSDCFYYDKCADNFLDAILINGAIYKGDAARFHDAIMHSPGGLSTIILRSNGGDVDEAMAIGRDVRKLLLSTEAPDLDYLVDKAHNYLGGDHPICPENGIAGHKGSRYRGTAACACASACFLIYVAGVPRNLGYVGIHRAYIDPKTYGDMNLDDASRAYAKIKKPLTDYLEAMNVSRRYADIMIQTPSTQIYIPKYAEVVSEFLGWTPEVEEWLIAKCNTVSDRQMEDQKNRAFKEGTREALDAWMKFRDDRSSCVSDAIFAERVKRRGAYDPALAIPLPPQ